MSAATCKDTAFRVVSGGVDGVVARRDLTHLYESVLQGEETGVHDGGCLRICFQLDPGDLVSPTFHAYVLAEPDRGAAVQFFRVISSRMTREHKAAFTFLCIGDPPRGHLARTEILQSFCQWGGWVEATNGQRDWWLSRIQMVRDRFFPHTVSKTVFARALLSQSLARV